MSILDSQEDLLDRLKRDGREQIDTNDQDSEGEPSIQKVKKQKIAIPSKDQSSDDIFSLDQVFLLY